MDEGLAVDGKGLYPASLSALSRQTLDFQTSDLEMSLLPFLPPTATATQGLVRHLVLPPQPPDSGQAKVFHRSLSCRPQSQPCCPVSHGAPGSLCCPEGPPIPHIHSAISRERRELPGPVTEGESQER